MINGHYWTTAINFHMMKLFLSSYQIGNAPEKLLELVGKNKRVALIMNAADPYGDERRPEYCEKFKTEFRKLGLYAEELDLRDFFDSKLDLKLQLSSYGLIWASGGNTFSLLWAMRKSGFDEIGTELIRSGLVTYGGFSAGACVLSPTLRGTDLVDNPKKVPEAELSWEGLGLVDFCIAPHYRSKHPESNAMEDVVAYYEANKIKYQALRDGEAIRMLQGRIEKVGLPNP